MSPIPILLGDILTLSYPCYVVNAALAWTKQRTRLYAPAVTPHPPKPPPDEQPRREALDDLERLRKGGDTLGISAMAQAARRAADHFSAREAAGTGDRIEIWGRRIGRSLSLVAAIGLAIYLYLTYVG